MATANVIAGSLSSSPVTLVNLLAPSTVTIAGTLTASNVINGFNSCTAGASGSIAFPTAASIAAALPNPRALRVGDTFLFSQFTTDAFTVTMTTATGLTLVGTMGVTGANVGGRFQFRCTAAPTLVDGTGATFTVTRVG